MRPNAEPAFYKCSTNTEQKMKFPLRISTVNVTKSAENCGLGHIYWRNPYWKTSFLCSNDKFAKYEKLVKDLQYCTRHHVITS